MKKNYYAVKSGRQPGIYKTWDECKEQVEGFKGASYKGFATLEEAREYMGDLETADAESLKAKASGEPVPGDREAVKAAKPGRRKGKSPEEIEDEKRKILDDCGTTVAFVDGSFDAATGRFSYGCVMLLEGETGTFAEAFDDEELASMHNVAGEIFGSMAAMRYCIEHGIEAVTIFHDYEGIAKWCTGEWKTNKEGTAAYARFYREASEKLKISFVKVKGHSGDTFNDMADKLAKQALGIA